MILHAHSGARGRVIDLDNGQVVPKVISLDTDTIPHQLEAYQTNSKGDYAKDSEGNYLTYRAKGRFQYLPAPAKSPTKVLMGAPNCAICFSPLTVPGKEICPICLGKYKKVDKIGPLDATQCDRCSRQAQWIVSDEVETTPVLVAVSSVIRTNDPTTKIRNLKASKILFDTGCIVGRRYYCSKHFLPPRILDSKGEVVQKLEDSGGVRPQWHS